MACAAPSGALACPLFPRGVYFAATDRAARAAESETDLHHPLSRRFRDAAHDRRRPAASRRVDRVPCGGATPGPEPASSSPPALRRARRRNLARRLTLDRLPQVLVPS